MPGRCVSAGRDTKKRLFFALWPDAETRVRLAAAARQWSRHPVPSGNLHVTLQFLGSCDTGQQACCEAAAAGIHADAFELHLDYLGGWPRKRIQWLGTSHPPEALARLSKALGEALEDCGFEIEKRPFVPHITLSRKAKNPRIKANLPAIDWAVGEFVLAESVGGQGGVNYVVRARWPLA